MAKLITGLDSAGAVDGVNDLVWLEQSGAPRKATPQELGIGVTETTTNLEDVTATINTSDVKVEGYMVFNATTNQPLWAAGNADGDVWVDATGATAHTPT